jgi:hypothetical protein
MGRYEPLRAFLADQTGERVPVTFRQIEKILGAGLPNSKRYPAWWSNNPSNNPMTKVWLEAGFLTEQVDVAAERLTFRRAREEASSNSPPRVGWIANLQAKLAGTVQVAPGWDLTNPTGEVWDAERE